MASPERTRYVLTRDLARRIAVALLSFAFPDACVACGRPLAGDERHACEACWREVQSDLVPGGRMAQRGGVEVRHALHFAGPTRALVHALKYDGRVSLGRALALLALPAARALARDGLDAVVPVPLHHVRLRERGFNQAEVIARHLAANLDLPVLGGLMRVRATRSQTGLSREERLESMVHAFEPLPCLEGLRVLLVDDVVTTGATAAAATAAAIRGGAERVVAFAVAASGPLRDPADVLETG